MRSEESTGRAGGGSVPASGGASHASGRSCCACCEEIPWRSPHAEEIKHEGASVPQAPNNLSGEVL